MKPKRPFKIQLVLGETFNLKSQILLLLSSMKWVKNNQSGYNIPMAHPYYFKDL